MSIQDETKPSLDELMHFGVKGQKWGVRRGKGTTGVSRSAGATIDRNDRRIANVRKAQAGTKYQRTTKLYNKLYGKQYVKDIQNANIKKMTAQNERLISGKKTIGDRVDMTLTVSNLDRYVSRRPV